MSTETPNTLDGWEDAAFHDFARVEDGVADDAADGLSADDLAQLKRALAQLGVPSEPEPNHDHGSVAPMPQAVSLNIDAIEVPATETVACRELADAYLEDASRGIGALDQAIIDYESDTDRTDALRQILRELHTLKGASAAVELNALSGYLHQIETFLESSQRNPEQIVSALLTCLATLRKQSTVLADHDRTDDSENENASSKSQKLETSTDGEDSIVVKGQQLNRLLDMVTSLTMLNNQRESHVDQLRNLNLYVNQCSNRIRDLERMLTKTTSTPGRSTPLPSISTSMREVGNDLGEISKLLRNCYSPIAQEHVAVTHFTQQFRHALVSILRMPVSGMFRRLQRAAMDAARVEGKQVRLEIIGSDSGLERSVQERLLDPLMHIVRNAVGHGIEEPEARISQGKDPMGTITLEASSTPNLLILNVRDDGQGLNYDALRRRGAQLGLLPAHREATENELGRLIFHPGFSTRDQANAVAGRGIGMDVVADTLEKLHAWVDIESQAGHGVTIKLSVPLKSITEHALIVRVDEHLVAIPMQYVRSSDEHSIAQDCPPQLGAILGLTKSLAGTAVLRLEGNTVQGVRTSPTGECCCLVDEIIGPQEVVVRPLPPILRPQPFMAGVTLSGSGDVAYVLDPAQITHALQQRDATGYQPSVTGQQIPNPSVRILIVDDSLSARKAATLACRKRGWETVEAANGIAGLELLEREDWTAIVTDFDMPQMDGIEFVKAVRSKEQTKQTPILMASSRAVDEMADQAISAGATHYVTKPVTLETLDQFVSSHSSL